MVLDNLNFTDVEPSVSAVLGAVPLIYSLNRNRYGPSKYMPQSAVGFVMANYLINSLRVDAEWDTVKKLSQVGLNAVALNYVVDSRSSSALMKYGSIALMASAFPVADFLTEKVIRDPDDNETMTVQGIPLSIISAGTSVACGWLISKPEAIPLINLAISSVPLAVSAFA
jgi:hypothetical protein